MISVEEISGMINRLTEWGKSNKKGDKYFSIAHEFRAKTQLHLSYHAEFGVFPTELISSAAPNESAEEFNYRKKNYKQKTKPVWDKALSATNRIFNNQNYSVEFDELSKDYFTFTYPIYGSYVEFFKDVIHPMKYADPNAVLAIMPRYIPVKESEDGILVDQSVEIEPVATLFQGKNVFVYKDNYCLLLSSEKSIIIDGDKRKEEGLIFFLIDEMTIYIITQVGKRTDWNFDVAEFYKHDWEQVTAFSLKGIPYFNQTGEPLYVSHFMCAIPNLDEAAFFNSTCFGVTHKIAYPTRWYYEDSCTTCSGKGYEEDFGTHDKTSCNSCSGTGKNFTFTWGKDYKIPMPENVASGDTTALPSPPFGVVDPPIDTIRYLDEKVQKLLDTAFLNLSIDVTEKPSGQSATEVMADQDTLISFLIKISGEEFYLLEESLGAQYFMRYKKPAEIKVNEPTEFRIKTTADLTAEYEGALKAGLPGVYLSKLLGQTFGQRFKNDTQLEDMLNVVTLVDSLMGVNDIEIGRLSSSSAIPKWWVTLHSCIYNFLSLKVYQDENYLQKDIEVIKTDMEALAKAATATPNTATDILNNLL